MQAWSAHQHLTRGWRLRMRRALSAGCRRRVECSARGICARGAVAVRPPPRGFTLVELLVVVALLLTVMAMALPLTQSAIRQGRARAAARYVAARLHFARSEAVKRSANVALKVSPGTRGYSFACYRDANGNGVLSAEVNAGIDPMISAAETLDGHFEGVTFGILAGVRPIDGGALLDPASSPIRAGASAMISFSALGGATPSTLYIAGRGNYQFAVRVLGDTGRVRVLQYDFHASKWTMQ